MLIDLAWTPKLQSIALLGVMLTGLALGGALSLQRPQGLLLSSYHELACNTGTLGADTLSILLVSSALAEDIAQELCAAAAVRQHFSRVLISWKPRTKLGAADLIGERYDVIWNRRHFLQGLMPEFDQHYDTLLHYDNYAVYWMSTNSQPVLSQEYFSGKRIGLLNDASSHTLHIIPLTSLRGLAADHDVIYFDDPDALFDSFYRGDIDLVTGGFGFQTPTTVYRTIIDDSATAATLFIRRRLEDPALRCELVNALDRLQILWQGIRTHRAQSVSCQ